MYNIDIDMGNPESGTPLIQMMAYAQFKKDEDNLSSPKIDASIVELFIKKGAVLSRVFTSPLDTMKYGCSNSTALELSISLQRFDIIEVLIKKGTDPILGGDGIASPLLHEYILFGTHNFVQWLFSNHLEESRIEGFIDRVLETRVLFRDMENDGSLESKSPTHALLLCGHKKAINYLLQRKPELLHERDSFKRTALHIAAAEGDLESVKFLLNW